MSVAVNGASIDITDGFTLTVRLETVEIGSGFDIAPASGAVVQVRIDGAAFELEALAPDTTPISVTGTRALQKAVIRLQASTADGTPLGAALIDGATWILDLEGIQVPASAEVGDTLREIIANLVGQLAGSSFVASPAYLSATLLRSVTGSLQSGQTWTALLNGAAVSYTATDSDTSGGIVAIAEKLAAEIDLAGGFATSVDASGRITVTATGDAFSMVALSNPSGVTGLEIASASSSTPPVFDLDKIILIKGSDGASIPAFSVEIARKSNPSSIRGPVTIIGGEADTAGLDLNDPVLLPGETNQPNGDGEIDTIATDGTTGVTTITDFDVTHVNGAYGERPGFDPRINEIATIYDIGTIGDASSSERVDLATVGEDILSFASATPSGVALTAGGSDAIDSGKALFFGTPDQSDLGLLDWLRSRSSTRCRAARPGTCRSMARCARWPRTAPPARLPTGWRYGSRALISRWSRAASSRVGVTTSCWRAKMARRSSTPTSPIPAAAAARWRRGR